MCFPFQSGFLSQILEQLKANCVLVDKVTSLKYSLVAVHLDRPEFFKTVLQQVIREGKLFGKRNLDKTIKPKVLVCNRCLHGFEIEVECTQTNLSMVSLGVLRSGVLHEHIVNLLHANGYVVVKSQLSSSHA